MIVRVWSFTVMTPERAAPVFCAVDTTTKAAPTPLPGPAMVIQGTLLEIVHGQPVLRFNWIAKLAAIEGICSVDWLKTNAQDGFTPPVLPVMGSCEMGFTGSFEPIVRIPVCTPVAVGTKRTVKEKALPGCTVKLLTAAIDASA